MKVALFEDFLRLCQGVGKVFSQTDESERESFFLKRLYLRFIKRAGLVEQGELEVVRSLATAARLRQEQIEDRLERLASDVERFKILKDPQSTPEQG